MVNDNMDMIVMVSDVVAMISEVNLVGSNDNGWWVDNGATHHVCADKSMCHSFRAVDHGEKLYMGNSATTNIKDDGMFKLNVMVFMNDINKINSSTYLIESSNVWHGHLGHINFNSMHRLIKFNSIPNFHIDSIYKCETCVEAKLTRTSFKSVKRKTEPLDMIHTDICDLKSLPTKGGNKYFITFVDDCTKYCYIYLLKSKDEAIDKFVLYNTELRINSVRKSRLYEAIEEVNTCLHSPSFVQNMELETSLLLPIHLSIMVLPKGRTIPSKKW
ncbi:pol polyprotein [Tanacetum coccineum]